MITRCSRRSGSRSARTRARTSSASTSASPSTASRSPTTSSTSCCAVSRASSTCSRLDPSYFEILTAAALRWFADEAVDVAVVEVGLGGTWDATNVVDADVAVVTNVEHRPRRVPRPDREQIAAEKAGIVKPGSTLVLGETDPELVADLHRRAAPRASCAATSTSVCATTCSRSAGGVLDLYTPAHALPRRVPAAARRAPGRQRRDRARGRRGVRSARRSTTTSCATRSRRCARRAGSRSSAGSRSCCSTARTMSPARRRCATRSRKSSRPRRARWSSACCARRSRTRCSTALGIDEVDAVVVCCRRRARARRPGSDRRGRGRSRCPAPITSRSSTRSREAVDAA